MLSDTKETSQLLVGGRKLTCFIQDWLYSGRWESERREGRQGMNSNCGKDPTPWIRGQRGKRGSRTDAFGEGHSPAGRKCRILFFHLTKGSQPPPPSQGN